MSSPLLLVYRALGLGDMLTGVPALRALRDAFPEHRLVLAAPAVLAPLAELSGAVDEVLDTAPLAVPELSGADLAVNLHGRGPESHRALLATAPRRMIAFAAPEVPWRGPEWRAGEHEVARWCRLLEEAGIPADPDRLDLPAPAAPPTMRSGAGGQAASWPGEPAVTVVHPGAGGQAPSRPREPAVTVVHPGVGGQAASRPREPAATVVHPGAASPARRWPAERWAAVARAERDAGRRVLVTGSAAERPLAERVAREAGLDPEDVLAGRTDVVELAAVVASAGLVLCGDTGVGHLATAFGVPSVLLFGPTPPAEWGPPAARDRHVVLHRPGRRGDPHGDEPDQGLLEITVADVLAVTRDRFPPKATGSRPDMGITDKVSGRIKQAAGDLTDDASMRQQGRKEERRGEAKEQQARAEERADAKAEEVRDLERET